MKYDDASWHSEGEYPDDLPPENSATHIGMFVAWAIDRDLIGEMHREESADDLASLRARQITPGEFLLRCCDAKFTDEELDETGNQFAGQYYEKAYLEDYERVLGGQVGTLYHVSDTWENFDRLKPVIDARFASWQKDAATP